MQLPSWDARLIDLEKAASSKTCCDELAGVARANGVESTELGTHLQGYFVSVHPACDDAFDAAGCSVAFELHPGEDRFDGVTFEMLLARVGNHPRCCINHDPSHFLLLQLDYLEFIDAYHQRTTSSHIKDAEFRPNGRQGVYGGYQPWLQRAGRFRSLGNGPDRLPRHLLEDGPVQRRQLGGAGMGVLP